MPPAGSQSPPTLRMALDASEVNNSSVVRVPKPGYSLQEGIRVWALAKCLGAEVGSLLRTKNARDTCMRP